MDKQADTNTFQRCMGLIGILACEQIYHIEPRTTIEQLTQMATRNQGSAFKLDTIFNDQAELDQWRYSMALSSFDQSFKIIKLDTLYIILVDDKVKRDFNQVLITSKAAMQQKRQDIMDHFSKLNKAEQVSHVNEVKAATKTNNNKVAITMAALKKYFDKKMIDQAAIINKRFDTTDQTIDTLAEQAAGIAQNQGALAATLERLSKANQETASILNKLSTAPMNKVKPEPPKPASQAKPASNHQPVQFKTYSFDPAKNFKATPTGGNDPIDYLNAMLDKYGETVFSDFNMFNDSARELWAWIRDHELNEKGKAAHVCAPKFLGEFVAYLWNLACEQTGNQDERISQDKQDKPVKAAPKPNNKTGQTEQVNAIASNSLSGWSKTLGIPMETMIDQAETCILINTTDGESFDKQDILDMKAELKEAATKAKGVKGTRNLKACVDWLITLDNIAILD
jgi:hypothetical protein